MWVIKMADLSENFCDKSLTYAEFEEAAKKFFNEHKNLRVDGKIPSIKTLKEEWAKLKSEKSSLYKDLNKIKSEAKELAVAKHNAEAVLFGENRERVPQKTVGIER
jgi:hypothetical protein